MTYLDSIWKSRDITLLAQVHLVKAMVFPVVMYGCESWTIKKAECWRIDAFELWCWITLLRVPWTTAAAATKLLQLCLTLCDPIDGSPPGSPVPGILQDRILEWVAISFSNAGKWKVKSESEVAQSCLTLRDPMGCSLTGSSVYGIFQVRVLEWIAIAFSWIHMRLVKFFKSTRVSSYCN